MTEPTRDPPDLRQRVTAWAESAPPEVRSWLAGITVRNFLRLNRNIKFQMQGQYDGAMSEECKATCKADYEIADALLSLPVEPSRA